MIIRENSMRNGKAESLPHLIEYLETGRDKLKPDERVLYKWTVNCEENDPVLAQSEIAAIASMNTRSKAQKYAHIVISPAPGETLTKDEWQECAKALVRKLDMTKHQYLCYVHKDTDQQHLHVIINLIDPETHARNSMPWSKRKEQELAQELEQKFSLRQLDHSAKHSKEETIARDIERKTGQQTLFSYISEFKDELKTAQTWQEFHQILAEHGIKAVYLKGRGLRFEAETDDKPISQKASAIDRSFSYAKLEKRFGKWQEQEATTSQTKPSKSYEAKPVDYEVKQSDREKLKILFDEFRDLQYRRRSERKRLLKAESEHSKLIRDQMRALKKEAEAAVRAAHPGDYKAQQAALKEVRLKWKLESAKQRDVTRKRKAEILKKTKTTTFQEYLRNLRDPINADPARDILASREGAFETQEINGIMGLEILLKITVTETGFFTLAKRTGKGQDIFTSAMSRGDMIRDLGTRILCNDKPSLLTVFSLLELGKKRYGDQVPLRVFGTAEFQRQAAIAASEAGIKIQCDDPKAQKFFDDLTEDRYDREQRLERLRELGRSAGDGDFTDSIFTDRAISAAANITTIGTLRVGRRSAGGHALRSRGAGEPDAGRFGKVQSSSSAGRKRGLSQMQGRDLDQDRKQRSVFLHGDASKGMGEHRLDELHADLRREVPRREAGGGRGGAQEPRVTAALDAAMAYVKERNQKRASGMNDIQEHQLWQGQTGEFIFRGYRHLGLDEQNFLLLEKDGKIYIKLTSLYEKERLKKYGRGAKVNVSKNGLVSLPRKTHQHATERNEQSRGRSR